MISRRRLLACGAAVAALSVAGPALAATFDTLDTDAVATVGITFSGGNLVATGNASGSLSASYIAQTIEGKKAGKWYVEFTLNAKSSDGHEAVGLVPSWGIANQASFSSAYLGGTCVSAPNGDLGWSYLTSGTINNKNTNVTAVNTATFTVNDVIGIAIDLDNKRAWWRKNTGSWIGTSGTPDPATDTNGFDISNMLSNNGRVYPGVMICGTSGKWTANLGGSAFTGSVPSGFTSGWTNTTAGTYFGTFATTCRNNSNSVSAPPANNKSVSPYICTVTGTLTSFVVPFAGGNISDMKGVIYDATGAGGLPGARLGISNNLIASSTYGEQTFDFTGQGISLVSGTTYWFGLVSDGSSTNTQNVLMCPPATSLVVFNSGTYASPTNPFGASPSTANFRYPIIINVALASSVQRLPLIGVG